LVEPFLVDPVWTGSSQEPEANDQDQDGEDNDYQFPPHGKSLLAQDEVPGPTSPDVRPLGPAVLDQFLVFTTGIEEGIGQDGETVKGPALVDGLGDPLHGVLSFQAITAGERRGDGR
jgi:hypothetical protein